MDNSYVDDIARFYRILNISLNSSPNQNIKEGGDPHDEDAASLPDDPGPGGRS